MNQTRLLLIYTGGTIGMIKDNLTGELKPFDLAQILEQVPEISTFRYQLDAITFDKPIDSSDMQPAIWSKLAGIVANNYEDYDGFIVLHGSDTMAYTASALSFMLQGLAKPVILTGSQLPIGHVRTDAKENLITSIEIAAAQLEGRPRVPEVCIYFDYHLYRGNRAIKYNSEKFEAFHSPNFPLLAEAGIRITYFDSNILPYPSKPFSPLLELSPRVGSLKLFPGLRPAFMQAVLSDPDMDVLVLEGFGSGNGPTDSWFTNALEAYIYSGKTVVDVTQCHGGSVDLGKYTTSARLKQIGVVSGHDMTFECCTTKSMFLLAQGLRGKALAEELENPLCGELKRVS